MSDDGDLNELTILAESESFAVLLGEGPEGEPIYNIEMSNLTLHLFQDEWEEFVQVIQAAARSQ